MRTIASSSIHVTGSSLSCFSMSRGCLLLSFHKDLVLSQRSEMVQNAAVGDQNPSYTCVAFAGSLSGDGATAGSNKSRAVIPYRVSNFMGLKREERNPRFLCAGSRPGKVWDVCM